ncbi:hypothetical protein PILCRDRAFT_796961 [Piloderma croceum F 1598]|uniref:Uncharacterized protein n=1 Tax=Piloderma croceum (strain F 1598) TaxID=765440 RepID=A0A0C3BH80_PILCF|nr:hypothetical protein PILCRDRAFT_796961 [Piloderma croceum F 1598]
MEERNSLEETDKIRVSLGFKSLVDAGPDNDSEVIAESKQHESKVRNRQELNMKLNGPTLGDADELEDTLLCVKKAKKRERELTKRTQEFENVDNVVQGDITKDELQDIEMAEDDKKMSKDLRTMSRVYTRWCSSNWILFGWGSGSDVVRAEHENDTGVVNKTLLSVNYAKNVVTTDYLQEGDVGFKRPETKKKWPSRQAQPDADPDDSVGSTIMVMDDKTIILKTTKLSLQEIAVKVPTEQARDEAEDETAGGLTFDDMSEFCLTQRHVEKLQGRQDKEATREYENRIREQQEARDSLDAFKNYKPTIDLMEYDEIGRAMTRSESWKALSHKFHGKGEREDEIGETVEEDC